MENSTTSITAAKTKCAVVCFAMLMAAELATGMAAERMYRRAYREAAGFLTARRFDLPAFKAWLANLQARIRRMRKRRAKA